MTPDELRTAAERMDMNPHVWGSRAVAIARAFLAALKLIDQARAHRDMEGAVAEFDRAVAELRP